MAEHYVFWNQNYGMNLHAGSVGENITLDHITEDQICVGDIVRLGTSLVQVSGPRVPCANQARHIGRSDWVKLTISENRTGFYLRVLEPGTLQACDAWDLRECVHPDGQIPAINRCMYLAFDAEYARKLIGMSALEDWWKLQFQEKLAIRDHWTTSIINY
jgi:MOSC domain-containing protein YiiM